MSAKHEQTAANPTSQPAPNSSRRIRAAKLPLSLITAQPCFHRIILDIPDRVEVMASIANIAVKRFNEPKLPAAS
ncbi:MAG: hypothetical protein WBD27_10915 [Pyrinomonadaceae bacterium]